MNSGRKYYLTCVILLSNYVLVFLELITGEMWINLCLTILGIYATANVVQKNVKLEYTNDSKRD